MRVLKNEELREGKKELTDQNETRAHLWCWVRRFPLALIILND
jgi:hypothetical protein